MFHAYCTQPELTKVFAWFLEIMMNRGRSKSFSGTPSPAMVTTHNPNTHVREQHATVTFLGPNSFGNGANRQQIRTNISQTFGVHVNSVNPNNPGLNQAPRNVNIFGGTPQQGVTQLGHGHGIDSDGDPMLLHAPGTHNTDKMTLGMFLLGGNRAGVTTQNRQNSLVNTVQGTPNQHIMTAVHEVGHQFGLGHPGNNTPERNQANIMNPRGTGNQGYAISNQQRQITNNATTITRPRSRSI